MIVRALLGDGLHKIVYCFDCLKINRRKIIGDFKKSILVLWHGLLYYRSSQFLHAKYITSRTDV